LRTRTQFPSPLWGGVRGGGIPGSTFHMRSPCRLRGEGALASGFASLRARGRRRAGSSLAARHALRPDGALLGGDAELGVLGAVAFVAAAALDDLEEEALAEIAAVELEIFAGLVPVVKDGGGA